MLKQITDSWPLLRARVVTPETTKLAEEYSDFLLRLCDRTFSQLTPIQKSALVELQFDRWSDTLTSPENLAVVKGIHPRLVRDFTTPAEGAGDETQNKKKTDALIRELAAVYKNFLALDLASRQVGADAMLQLAMSLSKNRP
jgi:hypothetical protein